MNKYTIIIKWKLFWLWLFYPKKYLQAKKLIKAFQSPQVKEALKEAHNKIVEKVLKEKEMKLFEAKKKKEEFLKKYIMAEDDYTRSDLLKEMEDIKKEFPQLFDNEK